MVALGGFSRENENMEWTVKLAIAHALTALAFYAGMGGDD